VAFIFYKHETIKKIFQILKTIQNKWLFLQQIKFLSKKIFTKSAGSPVQGCGTRSVLKAKPSGLVGEEIKRQSAASKLVPTLIPMSLIFVTFIFCTLIGFSWSLLGSREQNTLPWQVTWLAIAVWIFALSAFRDGGSDWDNYEALYHGIATASSLSDAIETHALFEPLYVALNYGFSRWFEDRHALIIFESAINAAAIFAVLTRVRGGPLLLVWLFPLQFANILGVRQTLATSLILIAFSLKPHRLRTALLSISPFIHLSGLLLIGALKLREIRPNPKIIIVGLLGMLAAAIALQNLIFEKLGNYADNAADLTHISASELIIGKLSSMLLLIALTWMALRADGPVKGRISHSLTLLAIGSVLIALVLPPLARLTSSIELVIALQCAQALVSMRSRLESLFLFLCLCSVATLKMAKIVAQFQDVYTVCFFCSS
jgi:hypothetical protein